MKKTREVEVASTGGWQVEDQAQGRGSEAAGAEQGTCISSFNRSPVPYTSDTGLIY